jgi:hypothetical protein
MATCLVVSPTAAIDDASFRLWGKGISDALQGAGVTKLTAGEASGQIDWATVAFPGVANTSAGYEMYRFSDTLQSAFPVIVKFEYYRGASGNHTALRVTAGKAQDGAGTFVGLTTTAYLFARTNNYAVPSPCQNRVAAGSNYFAFNFNFFPGSGTNQPYSFSIERTKNAAGQDTSYGFVTLIGNGAAVWYNTVYTFDSGELSRGTVTKPETLAPTVGHGSTGAITAIYPAWYYAGPFLGQHTGYVFAFPGNITSGVPFTLSIAGSTKTYMPLTSAYDSGLTDRGGATLIQCVRWD